jgi:hypothetical protein
MRLSKEELLTVQPWMLEGNLSTRAFNILADNGIDSVEKLIAYNPSQFRKFRNCGRKTVNEIREFLQAHQLDLAKYPSEEKDAEIERLKNIIRSLCQELEMWVGKEEENSSSGGILDNGRELIQRAREATK